MYLFTMKLFYILILIPTLTFGQLLTESDKQKHFSAGVVLGGIAYGIVLEETEDKTAALVASIVTAFAAGYIKETFDSNNGIRFDNRDLLATTYGGLSMGITLDIFARNGKRKKRIFKFKRKR